MNSMCERCPGWSCCCLDYNGDACQHWRANNAPDVVFTNFDALKAMDQDELSDQLVITITGLSDLTMHLAAPVGKMFISEKAAVQSVKDWMDEEAGQEPRLIW